MQFAEALPINGKIYLSRSIPRDEERPAPLGRDADAIEDVGAVGLHFLVVAGRHDLEQLYFWHRREPVKRHGEEIGPDYISFGVPTSRWT